MIIVKRSDKLQDGIVFNRKYRFKNPSVVIRTWYGLKLCAGSKWFRLWFRDKEAYDKILFTLDLDKTKGE